MVVEIVEAHRYLESNQEIGKSRDRLNVLSKLV